MYGWLAAPFVLVAGSSPAGHAPANAESSRTVSDPPFFGVPCAPVLVVDDLLVLLLPHATSARMTPANRQIATSGLTRSVRDRTAPPRLRSTLPGVIAHPGRMCKMSGECSAPLCSLRAAYRAGEVCARVFAQRTRGCDAHVRRCRAHA